MDSPLVTVEDLVSAESGAGPIVDEWAGPITARRDQGNNHTLITFDDQLLGTCIDGGEECTFGSSTLVRLAFLNPAVPAISTIAGGSAHSRLGRRQLTVPHRIAR